MTDRSTLSALTHTRLAPPATVSPASMNAQDDDMVVSL